MSFLAPPRRAIPFLVLFCLALYLPGFFTLPAIDRDESRFAQASRQMAQTHDYVNINFQETPRHKKPIGIYWLQAAAAQIVGEPADNPIVPYRLPSLLAMIGAVLLTYQWARRAGQNDNVGLIAALLLGGCLMAGFEARMAKTDAFLLFTIIAAQYGLWQAYHAAQNKQQLPVYKAVLFWVAVAGSILIKGPIILVATGGTALLLSVWERSGRWLQGLRPQWGWLVTAALVAPWLIAISLATNGAFWAESVGHDLLGKVASAQESHGAPPGFYALTFIFTFWPGSLLVLLAAPFIWQSRHDKTVRFCLAWILPTWLMFELVPTKLLHYTLPVFPALALLAALFVTDAKRSIPRVAPVVFLLWSLVAAALLVLFLVGADKHYWPMPMPVMWTMKAIVAVGLCLVALALYRRQKDYLVIGLGVCMLLWPLCYGVILPNAQNFFVSRLIANEIQRLQATGRPLALAGYNEASAVITLGTQTKLLTSGDDAAHFLKNNPSALVAVTADKLADFTTASQGMKSPPKRMGMVTGYNYAKGKWVTLSFYGAP